MTQSREPIRNTCPTIDKYIESINYTISLTKGTSTWSIESLDAASLIEVIEELKTELHNCISYLEVLRTANDKLRRWGQNEAEEVDNLSNEVNRLNCRIDELDELVVSLNNDLNYCEALKDN
jgi:vacuolar-type H+-ATPase subunit I/STV1